MKFTIVSPSYNRAESAQAQAYLPECQYVVHQFEKRAYQKAGKDVIAIPDRLRGNIARVRNWILDHYNPVLMLDDDVVRFQRWNRQKMVKLSSDEAMEFIEHAFMLAKELGARLWGMNLLVDKAAYREHTPFAFRSVVLAPCHGHIDNKCRYDETLTLKEDYDMSLQVLNRYRRTLRFNAYMYACDHFNTEGGCASYRTMARERSMFKRFQQKWGSDIVRVDRMGGQGNLSNKTNEWDINPIVRVPIRGV